MNERIEKLAEQAGLKYHNWITNESNINDGNFKYPRLEDYKKFAELIVRECLDKVAEAAHARRDPFFAYSQILEHFGVEE